MAKFRIITGEGKGKRIFPKLFETVEKAEKFANQQNFIVRTQEEKEWLENNLFELYKIESTNDG